MASAARGFGAFRQRPFAYLTSFGALHVGLAWGLVPPLYWVLHSTNSATAMLAGPQAAYVLSRKVPSWVPVPGYKAGLTHKASAGGDETAGETQTGERTVEDCLEAVVRSSIAAGWTGGKAVLGGAKSLTAQLSQLGGVEKPEEAGQIVSDALKDVTGGHGKSSAKLKSLAGDAWNSTVGKGAREHASDLRYAQIRDAVAAWVIVKVSSIVFPAWLALLRSVASSFPGLITCAAAPVHLSDAQSRARAVKSVREGGLDVQMFSMLIDTQLK